ncbi:unnamed protein product [Symbiodinium sp. KB8]|nr:unnamed protein product [Symbiodinium sp. KB8]
MLISGNPLVSAAGEDSTESAGHCSRIPSVWCLNLARHQGGDTGVLEVQLLDNSRLQSGCSVSPLIGSFEHFEELGERTGLAETAAAKDTMCLIGMSLMMPLLPPTFPASLIPGILEL